ncbi:MAG: hypothetical protein HC922_01270 [Leptolyngbyaceae cyanobacterium SM2_3_12]|nr:hypothetical protein [Leptolyngbyaceae cyanobacterium SM2_3_12]
MKFAMQTTKLWLASLGLMATATAVRAEPPGVFYSWRATNTDVPQCITQAEEALMAQNLTAIQADATSVAGRSEDITAVFICLDNAVSTPASTTVMIIVAGTDDEQTVAMREALKTSF